MFVSQIPSFGPTHGEEHETTNKILVRANTTSLQSIWMPFNSFNCNPFIKFYDEFRSNLENLCLHAYDIGKLKLNFETT